MDSLALPQPQYILHENIYSSYWCIAHRMNWGGDFKILLDVRPEASFSSTMPKQFDDPSTGVMLNTEDTIR